MSRLAVASGEGAAERRRLARCRAEEEGKGAIGSVPPSFKEGGEGVNSTEAVEGGSGPGTDGGGRDDEVSRL